MSIYSLAEMLHKFAWEVEQMPMSEFMNWIKYMQQKKEYTDRDTGKPNLLEMDPSVAIGMATGGNDGQS